MNTQFYSYLVDENQLIFEFESVSNKKKVTKRIVYSSIDAQDKVYNLFLGDVQENGTLTDISVSNNDDIEKILATVVHSMFDFFELHPGTMVYFTGSTAARTRLYRIVISNYSNEFQDLFVVYGVIGNIYESFEPNKNYEAYLISSID